MTIASTGNATDFGDLLDAGVVDGITGTGSETRGVFAGGAGESNVIQYITIASTGNSTDFGDLSPGVSFASGCSNAHGGL